MIILFNFLYQLLTEVVNERRVPPHCITCNCVPRYLAPGLDLQKAMSAAAPNYTVSNTTDSSKSKSTFMVNDHLNQIRIPVEVNASISYNTMKSRNCRSTSPIYEEGNVAPSPPKLRNCPNSSSPVYVEGEESPKCSPIFFPLPVSNSNSKGNINNTTPQSITSPPQTTKPTKSYLKNTLIDNNDADDELNSPYEQDKSAIKAAFETQQKEFLLQQQQQQHHMQQRLQHMYDEEHSFDQSYSRSLFNNEINSFLQDSEHNARQRKERMSKRQKELYVEFLEQNPVVNNHRRNDPALDGFWLRLANILNDCPNGAAKSVAEWKQAFDNWRYRVFLYARHNSQLSGDSRDFKPLTLTDKRAYNLWIKNPDTAPANVEKLPADYICTED